MDFNIEEELVRITSKLVSFKTTQDNPEEIKKAIDYIKEELTGFNFSEYKVNGKPSLVVYKGVKERKKFKFILLCHIDVVPACEKDFKPVYKKGKIYGRGALDMKAGCAIGILLMKKIKPENIALIFTSDEEIGGRDGTLFLVKKKYRADFVISLESTNKEVIIERKGTIRVLVESKGRAVHSSIPWEGENAIEKLLYLYLDIKKLFPVIKKESSFDSKFRKTLNLAYIKGGDVLNKVPDNGLMGIDIRYTKKDNPEKIVSSVKEIVNKHKCGIKEIFITPVNFVNSKNKYVRKLVEISNFKIGKRHGASDTRYFYQIGIPAVDLGPSGKNHHGKNEYVEVKSMIEIYKVLLKFFTL